MVIYNYRYKDMDTVDEFLDSVDMTPDTVNGLRYTPSTPLEEDTTVNGYAYHTHYAYEGPDIHWVGVKCEQNRSTARVAPSFRSIISLYGLNDGHVDELVGEKVYTTINTTPTTDYVVFDLLKSADQPSLFLSNDTSTSPGYLQVNLPVRYNDNYSSAVLTVLEATPVSLAATPDDYGSSIYFATPATWADSSPATLTITEYNGSAFTTNSVNVVSTSTLILGYDSLDKYDALRLGLDVTVEATPYQTSPVTVTPYTISFDNLEYKYKGY